MDDDDLHTLLSLWYDLAEATSLNDVFWNTFATAHDLDTIHQENQECRLRLNASSTGIRLFDALYALYEICERWSLQWAPWHDGPHCTLVIARDIAVPASIASKQWVLLAEKTEFSIEFWYALAKEHHLDIGEIGPETSRHLRLQAQTTAKNLFDCLLILGDIGRHWSVNWDLVIQRHMRTVTVVESASSDAPHPLPPSSIRHPE